MLETSGLLLTKRKDGTIRVEYVDYDTPMGGDYESIYELDKENSRKLKRLMRKKHPFRTLKKALICEVGVNLDDFNFVDLLEENDIEYQHYTWLS